MTEAEQLALYNNTVIPLIKENGFEIILHKANTGTYNPDTGFTPSPDTDSSGYAIEEEVTEETVPNSLAGKVEKIIMAIEIDEPDITNDTVEFKGNTYKILKIGELSPGNVSFFYTLYLEK